MSKSRDNPFPGMNPYFEESWSDIHATMIVACRAQLQRQLPSGLRARIETGLKIDAGSADEEYRRPDASIWRLKEDETGYSAKTTMAPPANAATPIRAITAAPKRRFVAIRETAAGERLVTAIEVLSPSNKQGAGAISYQFKRDFLLEGGANLVEIDLVREGGLAASLFENDDMLHSLKRQNSDPLPNHLVTVIRSSNRDELEFYPISYCLPLPSCAIPLRDEDQDIWLDLQDLAIRCFDEGGFCLTDYSKNPEPKLREQETQWLEQLLKSKGLR